MDETVSALGERALIRRLAARLGAGREVALGIGDDAAVVRPSGGADDWVLTSDPVVESVHFVPGTAPERVGHKAVGRVLSDCAAMGADPLWLLIDVSAPPDTPAAFLERAYDGANALARRHGAAVIGGDVTSAPSLQFHVFGVARVPRGTALTRAGARPGDRLFVTGELGGSLAGRHLDFEPRVAEAGWLREGGWARAALDVSDGLAADVRRLAEQSGVGACIRLADLPVSAAARAARDGRAPWLHALDDGEDFELLFAVPAERAEALVRAWTARFALACTEVGEILPSGAGIVGVDAAGREAPLSARGYEHFFQVDGTDVR